MTSIVLVVFALSLHEHAMQKGVKWSRARGVKRARGCLWRISPFSLSRRLCQRFSREASAKSITERRTMPTTPDSKTYERASLHGKGTCFFKHLHMHARNPWSQIDSPNTMQRGSATVVRVKVLHMTGAAVPHASMATLQRLFKAKHSRNEGH